MKPILQFIRRRLLQKCLAVTLSCTIFIMSSCAVYSTRPVPITELSLDKELKEPRNLILHTDTGKLGIAMTKFHFPYVYGKINEPGGRAECNLQDGASFIILKNSEKNVMTSRNISLSEIENDPNALLGKDLFIQTKNFESVTLMDVSKIDLPWVEGKSVKGKGNVRADLKNVTGISIKELNGPVSFLASVGAIVGIFAVIFLIIMIIALATKESCPFVYIDRGYGWELVGEAYAGAAFRSIERDDLLPLPDVDKAEHIKLRLKNEARETQYTDRAELVLVDHSASERALSAFDGRIMMAGDPRSPIIVTNSRGNDITRVVAHSDSLIWQNDIGGIAESGDTQLQDQLTAEFELPSQGKPVLEMVCGNTAWLDMVFGRFFAAMGDRLPGYLEKGNDPAAGSRIQAWREREGVDLRIEIKTNTGWKSIAVVPTVGPIALRHIAVPLPTEENSKTVTVRMSSGLGFWRFDRLAISAVSNSDPQIHHIQAESAVSSKGIDQINTILQADGQYNVLSEVNECLDMAFTLPARYDISTKRSAFIFTRGYYNVHQPVQSQWSPRILKSIRDDQGGLARFGRNMAREYLRMYADTKATEAHR